MLTMKRICLLLLPLMFAATPQLQAQQDVMISQYLFNGLLVNPGYAGSHPYTSSTLLHRSQWTQFDGAPTTSIVAVDGALRNNSLGIGLLMIQDQIGLNTQSDVSVNVAYRVRLGAGKLAFGLKGGLSNMRADLFAAELTDPGDPNYAENQQITQVARFGFGAYYHMQRFYLGVAIPTLFSASLSAFDAAAEPHMLTTATTGSGVHEKVQSLDLLDQQFAFVGAEHVLERVAWHGSSRGEFRHARSMQLWAEYHQHRCCD